MGFLPFKVNIWLKSALLTLSVMLSTFYLNYCIIYFIKNIINYLIIISLISFLYVNSLHCLNDYFYLDLQN